MRCVVVHGTISIVCTLISSKRARNLSIYCYDVKGDFTEGNDDGKTSQPAHAYTYVTQILWYCTVQSMIRGEQGLAGNKYFGRFLWERNKILQTGK